MLLARAAPAIASLAIDAETPLFWFDRFVGLGCALLTPKERLGVFLVLMLASVSVRVAGKFGWGWLMVRRRHSTTDGGFGWRAICGCDRWPLLLGWEQV